MCLVYRLRLDLAMPILALHNDYCTGAKSIVHHNFSIFCLQFRDIVKNTKTVVSGQEEMKKMATQTMSTVNGTQRHIGASC